MAKVWEGRVCGALLGQASCLIGRIEGEGGEVLTGLAHTHTHTHGRSCAIWEGGQKGKGGKGGGEGGADR